MKAVILAGRPGRELRPLTCFRPTSMLPLINRPLVEHLILVLRRHGIKEVILSLLHRGEVVRNYFGGGKNWGVDIIYGVEEEPQGIVGEIKALLPVLGEEPFLVLGGHILTDIDLSQLMQAHREKGGLATIALSEVDNGQGKVLCGQGGVIEKFLSPDEEASLAAANGGIYCLSPEIFKKIPDISGGEDLYWDVFPALSAGSLFGYMAKGYMRAIHDLEGYKAAHWDALDKKVNIDIEEVRLVKEGISCGSGCQIDEGIYFEGPVYIGQNCRLQEGARVGPYSVIGNAVHIKAGAVVERSIIGSGCYLGEGAAVQGAFIGQGCEVQDYTRIDREAAIGEGTKLGVAVNIKEGVRVWPGRWVSAGATVNNSMGWEGRRSRRLFGWHGVKGTAGVQMTPEFAAKLGATYASMLEEGSFLAISRDTKPISRIIKRALISGLLSMGTDVYNLQSMPSLVTRYSLQSLGAIGGIHVRNSRKDPGAVVIEFFDSDGVNISPVLENYFESLFSRDELRWLTLAEFGKTLYPPGLIEFYAKGLMEWVNAEAICRRNFALIVDSSYGSVSNVCLEVMTRLGCRVINLRPEAKSLEFTKVYQTEHIALEEVENFTKLEGDLGIMFDGEGERLLLVDNLGNPWSMEETISLLIYYVINTFPKAKIALPGIVPPPMEEMIKRAGGEVIRTAPTRRSLLVEARDNDVHLASYGERLVFQPFHVAFNAVAAAVLALDILAREKRPLSEIRKDLPSFTPLMEQAACPIEHHRKVMRRLMGDTGDDQTQLRDGLRIFNQNGWILIQPQPDQPYINLSIQAETSQVGEKLLAEYKERVAKYQ
ncbi:MAG: sugar phosphate nucleotidyltransferase [bacterium]